MRTPKNPVSKPHSKRQGGGPASQNEEVRILIDGLAACRRAFVVVGLFSLAINILMLTMPIYLFQISDRVLASGSHDTLIMLTVVAIGAILAMAMLEVARRMLLTRVSLQLESVTGGPILAAGLQPTQQGSQDIQGLRDLALLRGFISGPVFPLIFDAPMAPLYLIVVFLIHVQLGFIATLGALLLFGIAIANQMLTARPLAMLGVQNMLASAQAQGQVRNAEAIHAMGMMHDCVREWGAVNARALIAQADSNDRNSVLTGLSKFIRLSLQIAMLGWGAYLALGNELTAGAAIAASIIAGRALAPVEGSIEGWRSATQARYAYKRIKAILSAGASYVPRLLLPDPEGRLTVEELTYTPPGQKKPIVKGITLEVKPGDAIGIIGPTGAGKSTLARLLVGALIPTFGAVRLDGTDIRNWDRVQFGRHVGYLPQDIELMPGTVASNIARMRQDVDSTEIVEAAKLAQVHELIAGLPQAYETRIQANGTPLSGGQRQRVALARAFFGGPSLVILDEPNANLDAEGDEALARALLEAKKRGITVLSVTQRAALLASVDKVLVMRNGQVEAFGPRDDVLRDLAKAHQALAENQQRNREGNPGKGHLRPVPPPGAAE